MALSVQIIPEINSQKDGRRYVIEVYSDGQGEARRVLYLGRDTDDRQAIANARLIVLQERLAEIELDEAIGNDVFPAMRFQSVAELLARLRALYRNGHGDRLVKIARWIRRRIAAGDITESQVMNAFGLTPTQWTTLKDKIQALDDALSAVDGAVGE